MKAVPYYEAGKFTGRATAEGGVTGGRFVAVSGDLTEHDVPAIAHADAGGRILGVAVHDVPQDGTVTVYVARGTVAAVEAGGAITAGDTIEVGANGTAVTGAAGTVVGLALADAAAGDLARVVIL